MRTRKNWQLYHDNAPALSTHVIQRLGKNNIALMQQPPYFPDFTTFDFWLSLKFKREREEIMETLTAELKSIPEEEF